MHDPIGRRLIAQSPLILDGGLATELERKGAVLDDALWSAKILVEAPDLIREVHLDYLRAGADCIATVSYQASVPGFRSRGHSETRAVELLAETVDLALRARDDYTSAGGAMPLIAVSVGPFGAYLSDGSEYRGGYDASPQTIRDFHAPRLGALAALIRERAPRDAVIAFETIPSLEEAILLAELLEDEPDVTGWMSFCCTDDAHCAEGQPIEACAVAMNAFPGIRAIGVNCTAPRNVASLVRKIARCTDRPVLAYPNAGETYDIDTQRWRDAPDSMSLVDAARAAVAAGAAIVGGCCRTTPDDIRALTRLRTARE